MWLYAFVPVLGIAIDLYILAVVFVIELWSQPWSTGKSVLAFDLVCAALALALVCSGGSRPSCVRVE